MGKKLTLGVGLLLVAVFVSCGVYALLNWKDVQIWYQLRELRRDPEHLARILDRPEGTPEHAAVLRYVRADGARHFLKLYVSTLIEMAPRAADFTSSDRAVLGYATGNDRDGPRVWWASMSGGSGTRLRATSRTSERLEILYRLVHENHITDDEGFGLAGHKDVLFQVLPANWGFMLTGVKNPTISEYSDDYLCIARRTVGGRALPPGPEVIPELLASLASEGAAWRALGRRTLLEIGCDPDDPVPFVLSMIRQERVDGIHDVALEALRVVDSRHLPLLLAALEDDNPAVRHTALLALTRRDVAAETLTPAYLAAARDEEEQIRGAAMYGLETLGTDALPALTRLLAPGPHRVRYRALETIGKLGTAATPAIPAILALIERDRETGGYDLSKTAAEVILKIEPGNRLARDILKELEERRIRAATPKDPTGSDLTRALGRVEELKRQKDASELLRICADASGANRAVPTAAMRALTELGMDALPALAEAVKDRDVNLGVPAVFRLSELGSAAVPALIGGLENPGISALAAGALGNMGAKAREAIPHLEKRLDDSKPTFTFGAALLRIDVSTADLVVPKVMESFKSADTTTRDTHLRGLIKILGGDLAPYLERARESENGPVRRAALRGLELLKESGTE